mgnify:CR=1 FL=1
MATPQLSPGILTREIDLTVGRVDNISAEVGAIAGPFQLGPIDQPIEVVNQAALLQSFGKPLSTDRQYEYWLSGSSYLSYGGVLSVIRTDGSELKNANAGVGVENLTTLKIKNNDDYEENYQEAVNYYYAAKNPGTWGNGMKVAFIDNAADQTLGINTVAPGGNLKVVVGTAVTASITGVIAGAGTTSDFDGYIKGIVTGVTTDAGGSSSIDVRVLSRVDTAGTETSVKYAKNDSTRAFAATNQLIFTNSTGITTGYTTPVATAVDWYDQQTIGTSNPIFWNTIAGKPVDSNFSGSRNGAGDSLHVVVIDDSGSITGIQGNILEKHTFLSKASDAVADGEAPTRTYYKNALINGSQYIFAGYSPSNAEDTVQGTSPKAINFSSGTLPITIGGGSWGQAAQNVNFSAIGNKTYTLGGGQNYTSNGGFPATLGDLQTSYEVFANDAEVTVDFLLMGPGLPDKINSQAKANKLIQVAESRKDCIAVISPHRDDVVGQTVSATQAQNILEFYAPLTSSSYAVFDSGWKYTFDRFNNQFVYIPCNPDVAGTMVRTDIESFPWFSPAGTQRGAINNAVKLAYNPSKTQRDQLYSNRVNPIMNKPGAGIVLFGDKTALGYDSAFDRINVRRLFLTVEETIEQAANSRLFEVNDQTTRSGFVNAVEPFLRDVQAKRGLFDFVVKCDNTNNTPDLIDNNEFRADIFLKPTKSINFITLTFVATRTGVDFSEVVGTV